MDIAAEGRHQGPLATRADLHGLAWPLNDLLKDRTGLVLVPPALLREVGQQIRHRRFTSAAPPGDVDAVVIEWVVAQRELEAVVGDGLERVRENGDVILRVRLDAAGPWERESIVAHLLKRFPRLSFRLVGFVPDGLVQVTPWLAVRQRLPRAWLFLGPSRLGKTNSVIELAARTGIPAIHGDQVLQQLAFGRLAGSAELVELTRRALASGNLATAIRAIFAHRLEDDLLMHVVPPGPLDDVIFEMWVPAGSRRRVHDYFARRGYFPFQPGGEPADSAWWRRLGARLKRDDVLPAK